MELWKRYDWYNQRRLLYVKVTTISPRDEEGAMQSSGESVFLYIDEAGDFNFAQNGSKYLILAGCVMRRPFNHVGELANLKYDCLEYGVKQETYPNYHEFHATDDVNPVRDKVFGIIATNLDHLRIYAVVIQKNKANPTVRSQERMYEIMFDGLVKYIHRKEGISTNDKIIVVTDKINFKGKNEALKASLKKFMKSEFTNNGIEYRLYQYASESDVNLQVADYCCWAVQRKWEHGDAGRYKQLSKAMIPEGDLFKNSTKIYYPYKK